MSFRKDSPLKKECNDHDVEMTSMIIVIVIMVWDENNDRDRDN